MSDMRAPVRNRALLKSKIQDQILDLLCQKVRSVGTLLEVRLVLEI